MSNPVNFNTLQERRQLAQYFYNSCRDLEVTANRLKELIGEPDASEFAIGTLDDELYSARAYIAQATEMFGEFLDVYFQMEEEACKAFDADEFEAEELESDNSEDNDNG